VGPASISKCQEPLGTPLTAMHDYVVQELPALLERETAPSTTAAAVSGPFDGRARGLGGALRKSQGANSLSLGNSPQSPPQSAAPGEKASSRYRRPTQTTGVPGCVRADRLSAAAAPSAKSTRDLDDPFLESQPAAAGSGRAAQAAPPH